jgi:hypothetical protein
MEQDMRHARLVLPAFIIILCGALTAWPQEAGKDSFLAVRSQTIALYANSAASANESAYQQTSKAYEAQKTETLLIKKAVFAELAGLRSTQLKLLVEILANGDQGPEFVEFAIETARAQGGIAENLKPIIAAISRLPGGDRVGAAKTIAHAFLWRKPPEEVLSLVRTVAPDAPLADRAFFAEALVSWGFRDEASELVLAPAFAAGTPADTRVELVRTLDRLGFRADADKEMRRFLAGYSLPSSTPEESLDEISADHSEQMTPVLDMANVTASLDAFLAKTPVDASAGVPKFIDRSIVLDGGGMVTEKAETLKLLKESHPSGEAQGLYGGALLAAGDAWFAEATLLAAFTGKTAPGENAHLDLLDSILNIGDATALSAIAAADAVGSPKPQEARMMSEFVRGAGDIDLSDQLFEKFEVASGIDAQTRFNWEGSRLFANYYLDTGRLELGRTTAMTALRQFIEAQANKEVNRSTRADQYVTLFARFSGVDKLLDYCRAREKDFPGSQLIALLERGALIELGRADEALAAAARTNERKTPQERDIALAAANAEFGRADEATRLYKSALARNSKTAGEAYIALADLYAKAGKWNDARELLFGVASKEGGEGWLTVGDFFAQRGQKIHAVAAYDMLDDLSIDLDPKHFGTALRGLAEGGAISKAGGMLGRRVMMQTSFDAKAAYIIASMPQTSASAQGYMAIAAEIEKGPLGADAQLVSLFYRSLSERAEMLLDAGTALAAAEAAVARDGEDSQNLYRLAVLTSNRPVEEGSRAALNLYGSVPLSRALIALIESELTRGVTDKAHSRIAFALETNLSTSEVAKLLDLYSRFPMPGGILDRTSAIATSAWPWVFHARLADLALAAGDYELADKEAVIAADGTYVGRALWTAAFYARAKHPEQTATGLKRARAAADHPALRLAEIDLAVAGHDFDGAAAASTAARQAFSRPPIANLFR